MELDFLRSMEDWVSKYQANITTTSEIACIVDSALEAAVWMSEEIRVIVVVRRLLGIGLRRVLHYHDPTCGIIACNKSHVRGAVLQMLEIWLPKTAKSPRVWRECRVLIRPDRMLTCW